MFQSFPKISRLYREIIITEKIDGTNAQILIATGSVLSLGKDGFAPALAQVGEFYVYAGSRSRFLTLDDDNFGFAAWVKEHAEDLVKLGPGRHFGEWWGQGIQRRYGLNERRFSLFDVDRWHPPSVCFQAVPLAYTTPPATLALAPDCCHVVPVLYRGVWDEDALRKAVYSLRNTGSLAAPGFPKPEGIVIYHTAARQMFKVTLENDDQPKGRE